ncbi:hypothetical protein BDZ89DRAFT_1034664 [Hymenopellis radicata]|nr:hypothetical protein BDZ89DRAFT_1034664 [Hymenopellis radicata]
MVLVPVKLKSFSLSELRPSTLAQNTIRERLRAERPLVHKAHFDWSRGGPVYVPSRPVSPRAPEDMGVGVLEEDHPYAVTAGLREWLRQIHGLKLVELFQEMGILTFADVDCLTDIVADATMFRVFRDAIGMERWSENFQRLWTCLLMLGAEPPTYQATSRRWIQRLTVIHQAAKEGDPEWRLRDTAIQPMRKEEKVVVQNNSVACPVARRSRNLLKVHVEFWRSAPVNNPRDSKKKEERPSGIRTRTAVLPPV